MHAPYQVGIVGTTSQGQAVCPPGQAGWSRNVTAELQDQAGQPIRIANITMSDSIRIGSPNDLNARDTDTGSHPTDSSGRWPDTYFVCSPLCPGSNGESDALQYWTYNGLALPHVNAVVYKCSSISVF